MASYYFVFECDKCGKPAIAIIGASVRRQDEIISENMTYDAVCNNKHESTYFFKQILDVQRKLTPQEKQENPELLGDDRFVDIE
ncbi:MAG: hypothetical protein ACYDD2_04460 [Candidatus Acidiferrales bacterium]